MEYKSKIKNQKGAITLYVLISMMFFLVIILGIYFNSSNKIQKQEKEVEKIQKEYEKNNINDIYENKYNEYINAETPTIQVYDGDVLKNQVVGEKVSSKKNVYLSNENVTLKFLSKNTSDKYAYSTTADGEKIKIEGNTLENINITTNGTTMYVYIVDNQGNYSKSYTAITMILVTLKDKTIYVEEGKETKIGEIQGENAGKITFGQIEDNTIIKLEDDTITGLKAGTTTLKAIEERAGATATITVKVVKLELASTSGTMLLGDSKTVKLTGINIGTLSVKINDEEISTVSINNSEMIINAKKAGNTTITITENNVNAQSTYELKVASVVLTPDGGTYTMPTTGNATIKTTVTTVNAEKIEIAWSDNAGQWVNKENNAYLEKTNCTAGTYYLYVKINGEAIYKSKEFIVGENTLETNKIIIKPSTTAWTNGNVTATVTYGSTLTKDKKAGYGTTLANAQSVASTSTSTNLTATVNGYFYAEATDLAGNKITTSLQISNIDKTKPTINYSGNVGASGSPLLVVVAKDELSGINGYQFSTDPNLTANSSGWISITTTTDTMQQTKSDGLTDGTWYAYVKDVAGNISRSNGMLVDKTPPKINYSGNVGGSGSPLLVVVAKDELSGINGYQFSTDPNLTANSSGWISITTTTDTMQQTKSEGVTEGIWYAYVKDAAGNISRSSGIIIDQTKPTISLTANTTATANSVTLTGKSQDTLSGITAYAWTDTAGEPTTWTSITKTNQEITQTITLTANATKYFWTKDGSGNKNVASLTVTNIVAKASITSYTGITVVAGNSGTPALAYTGSPKSKSFSSSNTAIAAINATTGAVTGVAAGTATMTVTLTNYDGTTVSKTCTVTVQTAVAKVGTINYASITNAIASITSGTVTLLVNQTELVTIPTGKTITLALNGKIMTGKITNNGTISVSGGTITRAEGYTIENNGVLTVNATINNTNTNKSTAGSTIKNNKGTLKVTGGSISGSGNYAIYNVSGSTTISAGTITASSTNTIKLDAGTLNISGGTIKTTASNTDTIYTSSTGSANNINISGGTLTATNAVISTDSNTTLNISGGSLTGAVGIYDYEAKSITITGTSTTITSTGNTITGNIKNLVIGTLNNTNYTYPMITSTGGLTIYDDTDGSKLSFKMYSGSLRSKADTRVYVGTNSYTTRTGYTWKKYTNKNTGYTGYHWVAN